jgi:hypothetical protein
MTKLTLKLFAGLSVLANNPDGNKSGFSKSAFTKRTIVFGGYLGNRVKNECYILKGFRKKFIF